MESVENNAVVNGAHILLFEKHSLCAAFYDSVDVVFCKLGSTVYNHVVALDRNHLACGGIGIILKPALHDTSGQLATDHSLEIRFRHLDLFGKVKYLYDVFIAFKTNRTEKSCDRELLLTVDVSIHHIVDVSCKLNPTSSERDNAG